MTRLIFDGDIPRRDQGISIYTGFSYEDFLPDGKRHCQWTDEILNNIDVLVDGSFVEAQKNHSLAFRGSENLRIIDMQRTRYSGIVTLLCKQEKDSRQVRFCREPFLLP